jgi:hypothetical protein
MALLAWPAGRLGLWSCLEEGSVYFESGAGSEYNRDVIPALGAAGKGGQTVPLRDHFRPPLDDDTSWEGLPGGWPMMIVADLSEKLPPRYVAAPRVHSGALVEIDVATYEKGDLPSPVPGSASDEGSVATAVWAPPQPTFAVAADLPDQDEYEVRVYDLKRNRRLVAAVEIVSPGNKDRPEHRRAFVAKCAALLQQRVSVAIVDLVTTRQFNLYGELLEVIGERDPLLAPEPPPLYAVACRGTRKADGWHFEAWAQALALGQPLPTLPLWLADNFAVSLELETSYEQACRILRIP